MNLQLSQNKSLMKKKGNSFVFHPNAISQITNFPITDIKKWKLWENKQLILENKTGFVGLESGSP